MTHVAEAVELYHKLLEKPPYSRLDWASELQQKMLELNLKQGIYPLCPFIRPHFLTPEQLGALSRAAELLDSLARRVIRMAMENPDWLEELALLPGEKTLATIDPGYEEVLPSGRVEAFLAGNGNGSRLRVVGYHWDVAPLAAFQVALSDLFYDCPPVRHLRRTFKVSKLGNAKGLIQSLLATYKQFGGRGNPRIGILEFRNSFQTTAVAECLVLRDLLRAHGLEAEVVFPEELDYRGGVLRQGEFEVDLVWRRVRVQGFLIRFDLNHPLLRAYRERKVCVVSSFRAELAQKRALLALLTSEPVLSTLPAAERRAVQEWVPWTRLVKPGYTDYRGEKVDLLEFIIQNREKLLLMPNDPDADQHVFDGQQTDATTWERVLRHAARVPMVVQEKVEPVREVFPVLRYGELAMRNVVVDVRPHTLLGKAAGGSTWLSEEASSGFSSLAGPVPTFLIEPRS